MDHRKERDVIAQQTSGLKKIFAVWIMLVFLLGSISVPADAADSSLSEVKNLLQNGYVDPVPDTVLSAGSIDEMLKQLGDPYTRLFSAQEYQDFIDSINQNFAGIGIYIQAVPEGIQVVSVIENSPAAAAGLQAQDLLTFVDSTPLAGVNQETGANLLRGPVGSNVRLTVQRGDQTLIKELTRQSFQVPTVRGQVEDGHIGYVQIESFGETTSAEFGKIVDSLRNQGVTSWIIDVRDDPGGYLSSALDLAGYFIGDATALQVRGRDGVVTRYPGVAHDVIFSQPVILLTNGNSASASEILTAAIKDHSKATIIGTKTYGKGSVQSLFPLSDGSVLKMTIAHFYTPQGNEINKVGILPHVALKSEDALAAARLLLQQDTLTADTGAGEELKVKEDQSWLQVAAGPNTFKMSTDQIRSSAGWMYWNEILSAGSAAQFKTETSESGNWNAVSAEQLAEKWPLYYPGYKDLADLSEVPLDKKFTVHFAENIDWKTVTPESLEVIEAQSGKRIETQFVPVDGSDLQVAPVTNLQPGEDYWIVIHPSICDSNGAHLQTGALAVATTK